MPVLCTHDNHAQMGKTNAVADRNQNRWITSPPAFPTKSTAEENDSDGENSDRVMGHEKAIHHFAFFSPGPPEPSNHTNPSAPFDICEQTKENAGLPSRRPRTGPRMGRADAEIEQIKVI